MNTKMLVYILTLLMINISSSATSTPPTSNHSSCNKTCGGISVPFPFGIGEKDCYLNPWYEVVCNTTSTSGTTYVPYLSRINMEVVNITLPIPSGNEPYGVVLIKGPVTSLGCSSNQELEKSTPSVNVTGKGSPYFLTDENRLVAVGCGAKALMTDIDSEIIGCESSCEDNKSGERDICNGYKCCQARLPMDRPQDIGVNIKNTNGTCKVAFLTNKRYSPSNITEPEQFYSNEYAVVELGWYFDTSDSHFRSSLGCEYGYLFGMSYRNCYCNFGYIGNAYLKNGCIDVDECKGENNCGEATTCENHQGFYSCIPKLTKPAKASVLQGVLIGVGVLLFVLGVLFLYKIIKRRTKILRSKKNFKRNGGLLLKNDRNVEMSRIFTSKELKKATDNFNVNRVLGKGGQGIVYKGMLVDGMIVAVKQYKAVDEDKLENFINEVVLLSQINHRNIVKLLGCCLETEVPILVYEYIPNGDMFKHLHDESDEYKMTWEVRLRVALEIAGALSYMHSSASFPIYHRDIKTTNVLLDEKYRAKVSDFGTSRSVTIDQSHLTSFVAGTFGYMDPEYFLSSQYTDKSDVYSFGVVLVELMEMAKLARKCLSQKGKKRPNMKEVTIELERIHSTSLTM